MATPSELYSGVKDLGTARTHQIVGAVRDAYFERWTSKRNTQSVLFRTAFARRTSTCATDAVTKLGYTHNPLTGNLDRPKTPPKTTWKIQLWDQIFWEEQKLDAEGLDDSFTIEDIAQIVAGRYRPDLFLEFRVHEHLR